MATRIHTAAELRALDGPIAARLGVPSLLLMETAGLAIADEVRALLAQGMAHGATVWIVCGSGNNGGDGWCAARHLHVSGLLVRVVHRAPIDALKGDAAVQARAAIACGVPCGGFDGVPSRGDVVVDAVLGTGLNRPAEGDALQLIRWINDGRALGTTVLAVDVPSGLNADAHHPPGEAVRADRTLALHALKPALVQWPARAHAGEVSVASIGLPDALGPGPQRVRVDRALVRSMVPAREADAHKGTSGRLALWAGSDGLGGAAVLACRGALRGGAGLVRLISSPEVIRQVGSALPEAMSCRVDLPDVDRLIDGAAGARALVAGPGLGRPTGGARMLVAWLNAMALPTVLDADALNLLAGDPEASSDLWGVPERHLITPHPAELARLMGVGVDDIQENRLASAAHAATSLQSVVLLKGAGTVIAHPDGRLWVLDAAAPALATGGTGDVLAGLCGALLAQGLATEEAAVVGAWLHLQAARRAAGGTTPAVDRGVLASEVADALPAAWAELRS